MSYKQLISQIKSNSLGSLYLIYGEEAYLGEDIITRIKGHLVNPDFEELNYKMLEGKDLTIDALIDACETLPFMASKKLVMVKGIEALQGKNKIISGEDEELLLDYFSRIPQETCLVFYGLGSIDSRKKLIKAIKKHGELCELAKLKEGELQSWIIKYFKKRGKTIEKKELAFMLNNLDYLGKNATQTLLDVENEMKKIISFMGEQEAVKIQHIEEVTVNRFQNDIFKLLDAIGRKDTKDALKRLNHILREGEAVLRIMATMSNQVKNILSSKLLMEDGYTSKMIASKLGIHPYVASKCVSQSNGYTEKRLKYLLVQFLEMDYMIKSGRMNDKIAMELLIIDMCK
ncbi:DNA polymerase III subunit delta [Alkaliphilus pronyensis]|uniref:DNA polymerase III subunit delta n=1 Tax=Alkaliphilus pronyensis TaxID=1482732 RepID=A0A6I0FLT1_9FIRM|nr:DNA polymerase III subunit delta [Alkaliphilus pronyensis]KAB3539083.1 DNA polymerase III subunit delta [Alkaliphilus pronyensis]